MAPPARAIAILGLGLIGGSLAQALTRAGGWRIVGWDRDAAVTARAADEGAVTAIAGSPEAAAGERLVVLATPVPVSLGLVARLGPAMARRGAVLTDVGSTKVAMVAAADRVAGLRFVGGHPMSGREAAGYAAADGRLFERRPWVLVPGAASRAADVARVAAMARACGARPVRLAASVHDQAVAAISQLPLVASVALAEAVTGDDAWPTAAGLAAQGWRDMSRLARGAPDMGAGMLATNALAVARRLRTYRARLDAWQVRLDALASQAGDAPDEAALEALATALGAAAGRLGATSPEP